MEGIDNILKMLPSLATLGPAGMIVFAIIMVSYLVYKITSLSASKPSKDQIHADNQNIVIDKQDKENPAANDALIKDKEKIKDLLD